MSDGIKEVKKYAHIENDMSSYDFWDYYIDWREPTPEDEIDDNRCYVEYGDYTASVTRAETAEAKLARVLADVLEITDKLPDSLYIYRTIGDETKITVKDKRVKDAIRSVFAHAVAARRVNHE